MSPIRRWTDRDIWNPEYIIEPVRGSGGSGAVTSLYRQWPDGSRELLCRHAGGHDDCIRNAAAMRRGEHDETPPEIARFR